MSDDDGDEVALGGDDSGDAGLPADTGPAEVIGRRSHAVSSKTRELLQAAVDKLKAEREPGDTDDLEPALESPADESTPAPADAAPSSSAQPAQGAAPVPSLDQDIQRMKGELTEKEKQLIERETALTERERAADLQAFADTWVEKGPIEALRNLLKARGIAGSDDEWKDEAAELITDLSEKVFGTKIDPTLRNTIDVRRAKRANSLTRKQLTDREQALERQRLEAKAESEWTSARTALAGELGKPEHRSAYNFLSALDNPAQVVMEWVQKEAQAGRSVTWQEAAKAANDYIHDQVAQHDKRWRPLLEKVSTPKQPPQAAPGRPPGTSQVTQPKPPPQQVQPPPKPQTSGRDWNETNRKETKRKMRAAFRQGQ